MTTAKKLRPVMKAIRVDLIEPDPNQPRKVFTEEGIAELAMSMDSEGLLQPITVQPHPEYSDFKPRYIIIAGERRWRAAGRLGWEMIPAIIRHGIETASAVKLQLLENIVRQDLNPIEEARALAKLLEQGYTVEETAGALGLSTGHVTRRVEMLSAVPEAIHLVSIGEMKATTCYYLSRLSVNEQRRVMRVMVQNNMNERDVNALCGQLRTAADRPDMFPEVAPQSESTSQVKRTFADAFATAAAALNKIEKIEMDAPGSVAGALDVVAMSQLEETIKALQRVKQLVRNRSLVEIASGDDNG